MGAAFRDFLREKKKRAALYVTVCVCAVLIAAQVACAALFLRALPLAALLLSNALTVVLMLPVIRCLAVLYDGFVADRDKRAAAAAAEALRAAEEKDRLIAGLQQENLLLHGRLETRSQLDAAQAGIHFVFKLETMEFLKHGYVVRKEAFVPLPPEGMGARLKELLPSPFGRDEPKEILYIHKFYYKAAIGIDFASIKYCVQGNKYLFTGVQFKKLHDLTSECVPEEGDINLCEVRRMGKDRVHVSSSERDAAARAAYEKTQGEEIKRMLDEDVAEKCRLYTQVFRGSLQSRYDYIAFADDGEPSLEGRELHPLNAPADPDVAGIAATMLMLATVIQETRSIDNEQPQGQLAQTPAL
ncbi:MAG TPA: hypothetical protein DDW78_01785 [Treponema sp.]|nr:hypothetical protein [Treponema sp.]